MASKKPSPAKKAALEAAGKLDSVSGPVGAVKAPKFAKADAAAPAKKPAAKKPAAAPAAEATGAPRGRAPLDVTVTYVKEQDGRVKRGFTREFADAARDDLGARGKKFKLQDLFAKFDQPRAKLMDAYYACVERGVFAVVGA